jgi:Icc-related predicted phosphoesterase
MRIVFVSDTHFVPKNLVVPDGDVLVHAGDLTYNGSITQIQKAGEWLGSLPHKYKVVIAGNHDFGFEKRPQAALAALLGDGSRGIYYLQDDHVVIEDRMFWGSPWSLRFFDWAFQLDSYNAAAHWEQIHPKTDVLITHGPPQYILDRTPRGDHVGDPDLLRRVEVVRPKIHAFGHIHDAHGVLPGGHVEAIATTFVNASICDEQYHHTNAPIVVDL